MKFLENLQYFNRKSERYHQLNEIAETLPDNTQIAEDILKQLGNTTTKCVVDKEIKSSYYVSLKDKIYLADQENCGQDYTRVCLVAHECIHSIQAKWLQMLNFIVSNLELITFVVVAILLFFHVGHMTLFLLYIGIVLLSCIPRVVLEADALRRSISTSKKYLEKHLEQNQIQSLQKAYVFQTQFLMPIFYFNLFFGKILRFIILLLIWYLK